MALCVTDRISAVTAQVRVARIATAETLATIDDLLRAYPESPDLWELRGDAIELMGGDPTESYEQARALDPQKRKISVMNTAKEEVRRMLERLPDEASFEEIQYQVYLLDEITRGEEELDRGEGIDHAEVKRRLARWSEK